MDRSSVTQNGWCTTIGVFLVLYLLVLSLQVPSATSSVVQEGSPNQSSTPASSKVESIEDLFRNYSDDLSRLSAAYDLIGEADEAKLIDLFDQATKRKYAKENNVWKSELVSLISAQLAPMNLDKTVSLYESQPIDDAKHMLYAIMHSWAGKDFDGAVAFARKQGVSIHSIALRGIVDASLSLSAATLMDLGVELGDVAYVKQALAAHQLEVDLADPDKAWASLIIDRKIHHEESFDRVQILANALIDKYGAAEANGLLGSITSPILSYRLRKSILSKIALSDPETAFNFALDTPNDIFGTMLITVVDIWTNIDPQNALSRVLLLEPSKVRDRLQERVISTWIRQDPDQFDFSLDSIPIEHRDTARQSIIEHLSKDSIEDALEVLPKITDITKQEEAAHKIVDSWLNSDPDATFQWLVSGLEIEGYRSRLLGSFLEQLADIDADRAFDLALSQPIRESELGLEASVIEELKFSDTDLALRLLTRVRLGVTQLKSFESVSTGLVFDQRTSEAVELGKELPEGDQVSYYNNLAISIPTQESPNKILEILPNVPVKEAQSKIAEHALMRHSFAEDQEMFSEEEVATLLQYVVPADLRRVELLLER